MDYPKKPFGSITISYQNAHFSPTHIESILKKNSFHIKGATVLHYYL